QARPIMSPTIEAGLVDTTRRTFDLERRVSSIPPAIDRLEDLLDVDVTYEGDEVIGDGDVLTWDEDAQRWVGAPGGGGGGGEGGSTRIDATGGGSFGPMDPPTDWTITEVWSTVGG